MDYRGTVLLVSHDRAFLNDVVTSTLVIEDDGQVRSMKVATTIISASTRRSLRTSRGQTRTLPRRNRQMHPANNPGN